MRRNVPPGVWGRPAWEFLRSCAEACDAQSAPQYEAFIRLLPHVLPCAKCRQHAAAYLEANPVDTDDLQGWLRRFEEHVSQQKRRSAASCEMPSSRGYRLDVVVPVVLLLLMTLLAFSLLTALVCR